MRFLRSRRVVLSLALMFFGAFPARGQSSDNWLGRFVEIPAVSGYEQRLAAEIRQSLASLSPKSDNLGNVMVTLGSGSPHRLIVTPMDEPGYVVSAITAEGFLRVQRLPQQAPHPLFDLLHAAQPVWVVTRKGAKVAGVVAGLSVHLFPGRQNPPRMAHPDEMYIDIGAASKDEVRQAGVDLLDPIVLNRSLERLGNGEAAAAAAGDRFGCAVLVELLHRVEPGKLNGTLTVAFAAQQWTGGRGLDRLLEEVHPDEMIYVGRLVERRPAGASGTASGQRSAPGRGVLLGVSDPNAALSGLADELKKLSEANQVKVTPEATAPPRIAARSGGSALPQRFAHLAVPVGWPVTPAEFVNEKDIEDLRDLLESYLQGSISKISKGSGSSEGHPGRRLGTTLSTLVETYGASGHEEKVRDTVRRLLPSWAKPETDAAGNLVLHLGTAAPESKAPRIAFVAHMDEIGYQVRSIEPDGRLVVNVLGGGFTEYFLGHPVLVHTAGGDKTGILELPAGWDQPNFEWPRSARSMDEPARVYVGAHSAADVERLGIKAGDWITVPERYRPLFGARANGRSFDDRVGCAALVEAVKALGPNLPGRDVTFLWSTEEEVGLRGAAAAAERLAKESRAPDFVFAVDTFVSSDSPLESKHFADAEIGKGFVVRAVDNSNITAREYVDRVVQLAGANHIPVQYGVTGGGNDGSAFLRYGAVDIPLAWPLRYSHSPGEVIDTRDLDALARIIAVLARRW